MIRTIVILGSSATALAVVRTAVRLSKRVWLVDTLRGVATITRHAETIILNSNDEPLVLRTIVGLSGGGVALIADCDRWLRFIHRNRDALEDAFEEVLHPDNDTLDICLHKARFLQWCASVSIPAAKFFKLDDSSVPPSNVQYPVIVRPEETIHESGRDLPKAVESHDAESLQLLIERFRAQKVEPVVCESALSDGIRQYSVGVAVDGDCVVTQVAEKVRPAALRCAGGTYVVSRSNQLVSGLARRVALELRIRGVAEVEILCNPELGRYYVVEVNARPWVQFALFRELLPVALGESVAFPHKQRRGSWLSFGADLYECFSISSGSVLKGDLSLRSYIFSVLGANHFAFWNWSDPAPGLVEFRKLAKQLWRSLLRKLTWPLGIRNLEDRNLS